MADVDVPGDDLLDGRAGSGHDDYVNIEAFVLEVADVVGHVVRVILDGPLVGERKRQRSQLRRLVVPACRQQHRGHQERHGGATSRFAP